MSDRLPSPRRRSGGRHVAPRRRPTFPRAFDAKLVPTRLAQGGVALGLVLGMGGVVVTAQADEPAAVVDGDLLARAAAARAEQARTVELRAQAVAAAQAAVEEVTRVRSDAEQVAVPEDLLAQLDAATQDLEKAIEQVEVPALAERRANVSRSTERDATPGTASPSPSASPTDAPTTPADETTTDAPAAPAGEAPADEAPADEPAAPAVDTLDDLTLPDTQDPVTTPLREALDRVKQAAELVLTTAEQKKVEAAAQAAADEAARAAAEEAARMVAEEQARRAAWKVSLQGYSNGKVPADALCGVSFDSRAQLRCDAAEALEALNTAFAAKFGTSLKISDSYRSYAAQVQCRANKGRLCAQPGTSNHGMGVAVDLGGGVQTFGTAQHKWMRDNAPTYDWTLPAWARSGGSKPEPWHWEYVG